MRIVFMGSPREVVAPLRSLLSWCKQSDHHQLVGVVSQPPRPYGRKKQLKDPPLAEFAKEMDLPILQPEKASDPNFMEQVRNWQPDLIITAAYGQILTTTFLSIPTRATINIHPSLLPAFRGATPVQSALLADLDLTGVTILFTVKELDAGAIIVQQKIPIEPDERSGELMPRLFQLAGEKLLPKAIQYLEDPNFTGTQQDPEQVIHCSKIQKNDGQINWQHSVQKILARYRAYHPWPGIFTFYEERRIVIEDLKRAPTNVLEPALAESLPVGGFLYHKPWQALAIKGSDGFLCCQTLKPQGSKSLSAMAFWNGLKGEKKGIFQ